jgi:hypothetical protein
MVQNNYTAGTMIVEAIRCPGGSEVIRVEIPPEKHKYIRYSDFHIQYNKCEIAVYVYLEGASEEKKSLLPSMIRDNEKIELNYKEGRVTVTPIKGNMIAMNGYFPRLQPWTYFLCFFLLLPLLCSYTLFLFIAYLPCYGFTGLLSS